MNSNVERPFQETPLKLQINLPQNFINKHLDIKLGQFTQEALNMILRKIKNRKTACLNEIPPEVWKTRKFHDLQFWYCNIIFNQNTIDRWTKVDPRITQNYWGINLTSIVTKVYNVLFHKYIKPEIEKILRIKMVFGESNP